MQYLGYTVVVQIRKEHFVVEAFLVLYEYVTRIADATMRVIENCDLDNLFLEETGKVGVNAHSALCYHFLFVVFDFGISIFDIVNPASKVIDE